MLVTYVGDSLRCWRRMFYHQVIKSPTSLNPILRIIFRNKIRIEINDGLIRVTTNEDGTWINTHQPFDLASQKIKKQQLRNMFIGIKGQRGNWKATMIVKLYKRTN